MPETPRPTDAALQTALEAARRMRVRGIDPHHLAHALLYLEGRNRELEALLTRVDLFLRFGMAEQELSQLRRLVERLREEEQASGRGEPSLL